MRSVAPVAKVGAALVAVLGLSVLAGSAHPAAASSFLKIGIYDEAQTLYGPVERTYPALRALHVQVIRLNLYWGGRFGVARYRPAVAADVATTVWLRFCDTGVAAGGSLACAVAGGVARG